MNTPNARSTSPRRVLLVDDEPSILFVLRRVIESRGWQALTASSGTDALGLAAGADALVTDLCMPGLNGIELIRALRRRGSSIPVLLLTADLSQTVRAQALAAGADRCMEKPFRLDELLDCLDGPLRTSEAADHGAPAFSAGCSRAAA